MSQINPVTPFKILPSLFLNIFKVSALVGELASKLDNNKERPELKREPSNVWQPPKNKVYYVCLFYIDAEKGIWILSFL